PPDAGGGGSLTPPKRPTRTRVTALHVPNGSRSGKLHHWRAWVVDRIQERLSRTAALRGSFITRRRGPHTPCDVPNNSHSGKLHHAAVKGAEPSQRVPNNSH